MQRYKYNISIKASIQSREELDFLYKIIECLNEVNTSLHFKVTTCKYEDCVEFNIYHEGDNIFILDLNDHRNFCKEWFKKTLTDQLLEQKVLWNLGTI